MLDEKKKVKFPEPTISSVTLGTDTIEVKSYLSDEEQKILIGVYVLELFAENSDPQHNYLRAENALIISVIELCTNIMLVEKDKQGKETALFNIDNVFSNIQFWNDIKNKIVNYNDFRNRLDVIVWEHKDQKKVDQSLPTVMRNIYDKFQTFVNDLVTMDISDEKMTGMRTLLSEINQSSILKESIDIFKNQKPKE